MTEFDDAALEASEETGRSAQRTSRVGVSESEAQATVRELIRSLAIPAPTASSSFEIGQCGVVGKQSSSLILVASAEGAWFARIGCRRVDSIADPVQMKRLLGDRASKPSGRVPCS